MFYFQFYFQFDSSICYICNGYQNKFQFQTLCSYLNCRVVLYFSAGGEVIGFSHIHTTSVQHFNSDISILYSIQDAAHVMFTITQ